MSTNPSKKPKRRSLWIDSAPGREHLAQLLAGNPDPLCDFYKQRVKAHPHRIIHDYLVTYGIFWDLERQITPTAAQSLINSASHIVLTEPRETRICAFALLANLCKPALEAPAPLITLPCLEQMHKLAEEPTLENDIHFPWADITYYQMVAEKLPISVLPTLQIERDAWKKHYPESIPEIPKGSEANSPMDWMTLLSRCGFRVDACTERPKFLRTAVLESTHYWCWLLSTHAIINAHQYLIVSQDLSQNAATAHKIRLFRPHNPALEISLLRWHYLGMKS